MARAKYFISGEKLPLPGSHLLVPSTDKGIEARIKEYRLRWLDNRGTQSYDKGYEARLAMACINQMLDHYPNGQHRDDWVFYDQPTAELELPKAIYGD